MLNVWLTVRTETGKMNGTGPWVMSEHMQLAVSEPSGKVPLNLLYMGRIDSEENGNVHLFELTLTGKKVQKLHLRVTNRLEIWNDDGSILGILEVKDVGANRPG